MPKKMRAVLVGCGGIAGAWIDPAKDIQGLEIVGFVDIKRANAENRKELYGNDKAAQVVKDKAQAMGVSLDWLQDAAAKSPSAFFSVMGISLEGGKTTTPSATVSSTTNTQAVEQVHASGIQQDTWKHFEEIRKSDPRTYWKAETQQRLFKARNEKGESFYT